MILNNRFKYALCYLIVLLSVFSFFTLNANAEENMPITVTSFNEEAVLIDVEVKELTEEEVIQEIALRKGISLEQATKEFSSRSNKTNSKFNSINPTSTKVATGYRQISATYLIINGTNGNAWSNVRYGVVAEVSQSGSFVWFSDVLKDTAFAQATGSGTHSYVGGYSTALLLGGNSIQFMSTGEVEAVIPSSFGAAFQKGGFTLSGTRNNNEVWRKTIDINRFFTLESL